MARIFEDNCGDNYSDPLAQAVWSYGKDENGNNSVVVSVTTTAGSSGNCLKVDSIPVGNIATFLRRNLSASYAHVIYGVRFKAAALPGSGYDHIITLWDNAATILSVLAIEPNGALSVWRGGYPGVGGTKVGTSTVGNVIQPGVMIHLSLDIVLDNAGAGSITLRADSQIVKTVSTTTTSPNANGAAMLSVHSGHILAASHYFDDLYLNDPSGLDNTGFDGDVVCIYVPPTAPGRLTQQSIGGSAPAATNWQSVNQTVPDDDVTYVSAATAGLKDTYKVGPLDPNVVAIVCVTTILDLKTDTSGLGAGATVRPLIGNGATESPGTSVSANTSYANKYQSFGRNPLTSATWTLSDWANIEIGHERTA